MFLTRPLRVALALLAFVLLAVALAVAQVAQPTRAAADPRIGANSTTTSADHPYGDPDWFPLRAPADIGCAKTQCGGLKAHGYWALDFPAPKGSPVYAAGAGIAHVGGTDGSCAARGGNDSRNGRWVWIDHGSGVVTKYHHLNSIAVSDGELVTPATRIGTVGHSGDTKPCKVNYLHFEIRHGGLKGKRVDPGQLKACVDGAPTVLPGTEFTGWDDPRIHTTPRVRTPQLDSSCISPDWLTTSTRPSPQVKPGKSSITVAWGTAPTGTKTVVVALEMWHPSVNRYGGAVYARLDGDASRYRYTGLKDGRTYRVTLALHNGAGYSEASKAQKLKPGAAPGAPRTRYAMWTKRDYIHYGWYRPAGNGNQVTSFTVASRCWNGGSYGDWTLQKQRVKDAFLNVRGLSDENRCQVKVRGSNDFGPGKWSTTSSLRWHG